MKAAPIALALLFLTACSGPADVKRLQDDELAQYQAKLAEYQGDMANAQEWNVHVLGIPASGWVAILSIASLLVAALLGVGLYYLNGALSDRRRKAHDLALEREKTAQKVAERGACPMCGHQPVGEEVDGGSR